MQNIPDKIIQCIPQTPSKKQLGTSIDLEFIQSPQKPIMDIYTMLVKDPTPKKKLSFLSEIESSNRDNAQSMMSSDSSEIQNLSNHEINSQANLNTVKKISQISKPQQYLTNQSIKSNIKICRCRNSQCLKGYCDCFKQGMSCSQLCQCANCKNKQIAIQHMKKKGEIKCNCQRSHCQKNYCQCHSAGKQCSKLCNCLQCGNMEESYRSTPSKKIKISKFNIQNNE